MQAIVQPNNTKPFLPSIKFLLESSVQMFNGDQIPVEPRNSSNHYINTSTNVSSRKLPTLSLSIPSQKGLISPVEESTNMSDYHLKGNQYQNNLPRLPSIEQIESGLSSNSTIATAVQKHSRPNSIQSLLSPPESPDMTNNPPFNDYLTHNNRVSAEQQQQQQQLQQLQQLPQHQQHQQLQQHQQHQQQRPRLVQPEYHYPKTTSYSSLTPHYSYALQSYPERGLGGYRQERVTYDRAYTEHRAYPSSTTSATTLQPLYSPYESVPTSLPRPDISRRLNAPMQKIISDPLTSSMTPITPITGIVPSTSVNNNRYQCPYCSKRFSRPSSLRIHTYSHTGEKPFVCTEPGCGRKFSVQSNMRRHLRVHRLGRPVKKVRYDGEVEGVKMLNHGVNHGAMMRNC